jgi:ADP-ribose pyrophosphatase YjhB (NUDIX family)
MYTPSAIDFCSRCGHRTHLALPDDGDTRQRAICTHCGFIHYQNPLNVVGTIPVADDGRILLCKRNIEPRWGTWTLPAGFMELNETLEEGAARETDEEAGADIEMGRLFSIISVPHVGQVHIYFCARLRSLEFAPGIETIEARLFAPDEIPWETLSFRTVALTLRRFLADPHSTQVHCLSL